MAADYVNLRQRSLVERILFGLLALALLVLGFFFIVAALVAGAILAAAALLRFWWLQRKLRKAEKDRYVSAEYTVVERESPPLSRLPPGQ